MYEGPWDVVSVRAHIRQLEHEVQFLTDKVAYLRRLVREDSERIEHLRERQCEQGAEKRRKCLGG